jgi:hypothetical protein
MTISSGGYNVNFNPTPTIYERQTQGAVDLQKKGEIGQGAVVIMPQAQQDMVPFTKLVGSNVWNYKAESDRPTLVPVGYLRNAGAEIQQGGGQNWVEQYAELYEALPEDVKDAIQNDPSLATNSFVAVMETAAKVIQWQQDASAIENSENAVNRAAANQTFPRETFANSLSVGKELSEAANGLLNEIDPNNPNYGEAVAFNEEYNGLLNEIPTP